MIGVQLLAQGWALTSATDMGWDLQPLKDEAIPRLGVDTTWGKTGKYHARDVLVYEFADGMLRIWEKEDNFFYPMDRKPVQRDVPRFTGLPCAEVIVRDLLNMPPRDLFRPQGEVHLDVFRTTHGIEVGGHKDSHAAFVMSLVLDRDGTHGENWLLRAGANGFEVDRVLEPGDALIFWDVPFSHGVRCFEGNYRDVLVATIQPPL